MQQHMPASILCAELFRDYGTSCRVFSACSREQRLSMRLPEVLRALQSSLAQEAFLTGSLWRMLKLASCILMHAADAVELAPYIALLVETASGCTHRLY